MNPVEQALHRIASQLVGIGQDWALVGGFAISARADPRFTRDVDVAVAVPDDSHAEQVVRSLAASGYRVNALVEQEATGRLATARLGTSNEADEVIVDLLFASSGIEPEIVAAADKLEIAPGLIVPVAQTGHLIAVKLLARNDETRPQDLADLRALLTIATADDLALARESIDLIRRRGFHRDRDLAAALAELTS
jgi:predicted nucleotidyltransferase